MKIKSLFDYSEYVLSAMIVLYWYFTGTWMNWVAIVLLTILLGVILTKNSVIGIGISALIALASMYMLLALLSEYSEFPSNSFEAYRLLIVGFLFIWATLASAGLVMVKYILQLAKVQNSSSPAL